MKTLTRALERISAFRMLDHYKRLQLILLIAESENGMPFGNLKEQSQLESNDLVYHMRLLERSKLVQKIKTGEPAVSGKDIALHGHLDKNKANVVGRPHYQLTGFGRGVLSELGVTNVQQIRDLLAEVRNEKSRLAYE